MSRSEILTKVWAFTVQLANAKQPIRNGPLCVNPPGSSLLVVVFLFRVTSRRSEIMFPVLEAQIVKKMLDGEVAVTYCNCW